jgi:hypothetical protein
VTIAHAGRIKNIENAPETAPAQDVIFEQQKIRAWSGTAAKAQ